MQEDQPMATMRILPVQQQLARVVAEGRLRGKERRRPENDTGNVHYNSRIDFYGSLAEMCLYTWLEEQGETLDYKLLTPFPERRADLIWRGQNFDVKCTPPGKTFLTINARQYQSNRCQYYWPVTFAAEDLVRIHFPLSWHRVVDFDLMTNRHSPYYSVSLERLRRYDAESRVIADAYSENVLEGWIESQCL
jgi:hypothetical protein